MNTSDDFDQARLERIGSYAVYTGGREACLDQCIAAVRESGGAAKWLACINPHSFAVALKRPGFAEALRAADILIPDGIGMVLASTLLRGNIRERVTGSDVFWGLHDRLQMDGGGSVYLLGSTAETLNAMEKRMAAEWPEVRVAGKYAPPFKPQFSDDDNDEMVRRINEAAPDVLWVGLSAPKQEEWIHAMLPRLNVKFAAAVGAVFDFYTGRVKRSHPFFQRVGLEWLPRLLQEPRRLWRRMGVSAPIFLWHVLRERFRRGRQEAV